MNQVWIGCTSHVECVDVVIYCKSYTCYKVENIVLLLHCTRSIVKCDEGQLLHYYIHRHDLQGRVTVNDKPTCVDFLGEYTPI